jgi:putative membrane protein
MEESSKIYKRLFIIISLLIPMIVALLLLMPKGDSGEVGKWIFSLPFYNAIINTLTALLLISGYYFVKKGKVNNHKRSMIGAFALGTLFLIGYVIYHYNVPSTKFGGEGMIRYVYFALLLSHVLLSIVVVPMVLSAMYFALFGKIEKHKKMVKFTFPIWLYVSISGVLVYVMISPFYAH